jgi:predicted flap endonuclease-1-like 5' DNA nuclease
MAGSDSSAQTIHELQAFLKQQAAEIQTLRAEQKEQQARYAELEERHRQYLVTHPDDLTAIRGIGRIYQWRLRDAGISSFEQLANTTPERLSEIMELPEWRKFDPASWIEQAKVLTQRDE